MANDRPKVRRDVDSAVDDELDSDTDSDVDYSVDDQLDSDTDSDVDSATDSNGDSTTGYQSDSDTDSDDEYVVEHLPGLPRILSKLLAGKVYPVDIEVCAISCRIKFQDTILSAKEDVLGCQQHCLAYPVSFLPIEASFPL